MKVGDRIVILEHTYGEDILTVGKWYEILDFDYDGDPVVRVDNGLEVGLFLDQIEYEIVPKDDKPIQYQIGIDTFQRAEANMTKEEILACVKFSIDKYNWRMKGQDKEDFKKIIDYANWGLKQLEDE